MNIEDAYFAGLVDGDGCIHISNRGELSVTVTNCYRPVLDDLCSSYGGAEYKDRTKQNAQEVYRWKLYCQKADAILKRLLPYLRIKRNQAQIALQHQGTKGYHKPIPANVLRERKRLTRQLRALNGGGPNK